MKRTFSMVEMDKRIELYTKITKETSIFMIDLEVIRKYYNKQCNPPFKMDDIVDDLEKNLKSALSAKMDIFG